MTLHLTWLGRPPTYDTTSTTTPVTSSFHVVMWVRVCPWRIQFQVCPWIHSSCQRWRWRWRERRTSHCIRACLSSIQHKNLLYPYRLVVDSSQPTLSRLVEVVKNDSTVGSTKTINLQCVYYCKAFTLGEWEVPLLACESYAIVPCRWKNNAGLPMC